MPLKIISGGQTGADYAALEAAKELGLETGGTAAVNFDTTDGPNPELGTKFGLKAIPYDSKTFPVSYVVRSQKNVKNADGTLAFRTHQSSGTDKTIGYCLSGTWKYVFPNEYKDYPIPFRPVLVLSNCVMLNDKSHWENDKAKLTHFLQSNNIKVLNVCGHRQNKDDPTWTARVKDFLLYALSDE